MFVHPAVLDLSCCVGDLVPQSGVGHGAPALEVYSLSHWTTRGVSAHVVYTLAVYPLSVVAVYTLLK